MINYVMSGVTIALIGLHYQFEVINRSSSHLNTLDRNLDTVNGRSMRKNGSNERKIDRKSCRPSALRGSLPSVLDQFFSGYIFEIHAPEGDLERLKHHGLRSPNWLANLSKIVEMQRDQVRKDARLLMRPGQSDWSASIN